MGEKNHSGFELFESHLSQAALQEKIQARRMS